MPTKTNEPVAEAQEPQELQEAVQEGVTIPELPPGQFLQLTGNSLVASPLKSSGDKLCMHIGGKNACFDSDNLIGVYVFGSADDDTGEAFIHIFAQYAGTLPPITCIWCGNVRVCGRNPTCW